MKNLEVYGWWQKQMEWDELLREKEREAWEREAWEKATRLEGERRREEGGELNGKSLGSKPKDMG